MSDKPKPKMPPTVRTKEKLISEVGGSIRRPGTTQGTVRGVVPKAIKR